MPILNFSDEIDLNYYRKVYPEFRYLPDSALTAHCKRFAAEQGRSTCPYDMQENLRAILQGAIGELRLNVLEISPWDNPFLRGETVKYFDVADSETLQKSALEYYRPFANVPDKKFIS